MVDRSASDSATNRSPWAALEAAISEGYPPLHLVQKSTKHSLFAAVMDMAEDADAHGWPVVLCDVECESDTITKALDEPGGASGPRAVLVVPRLATTTNQDVPKLLPGLGESAPSFRAGRKSSSCHSHNGWLILGPLASDPISSTLLKMFRPVWKAVR